jgi:uncharacterized membrane protein
MQSRAAIFGHPLHPIFVTIPVGLWSVTPACDLLHWYLGDPGWKTAGLFCVAVGVLGAIPAIITGLIDYPLAQGRAAAVAKFHLILNLAASVIFLGDAYLRWAELYSGSNPPVFANLPVVISLVGVVLIGLSGFLGGELISRFGISVHSDAV